MSTEDVQGYTTISRVKSVNDINFDNHFGVSRVRNVEVIIEEGQYLTTVRGVIPNTCGLNKIVIRSKRLGLLRSPSPYSSIKIACLLRINKAKAKYKRCI
jgi:hypothetical protein